MCIWKRRRGKTDVEKHKAKTERKERKSERTADKIVTMMNKR